ncbi:MAG: hypothetical protein M1365_01355 [Actinobacteria bacterium]|nr:hypothetical protein [Actinomycetota bacterium]
MPKSKRKPNRGRFLIETLLAITLTAVIAFAFYGAITPQLIKAEDGKIKFDLTSIRTALLMYYDDNGCFPKTIPFCGSPFEKNGVVYIKKIPCQKFNIPYAYENDGSSCSHWFKLLVNLNNRSDKSIKAVGCSNGCGKNCNYNYGVSENITINSNCPASTPIPTTTTNTTTAPSTSTTVQGHNNPNTLYACTPSGYCIRYVYPQLSECPKIYIDDDTCRSECRDRKYRCKNERGKTNAPNN